MGGPGTRCRLAGAASRSRRAPARRPTRPRAPRAATSLSLARSARKTQYACKPEVMKLAQCYRESKVRVGRPVERSRQLGLPPTPPRLPPPRLAPRRRTPRSLPRRRRASSRTSSSTCARRTSKRPGEEQEGVANGRGRRGRDTRTSTDCNNHSHTRVGATGRKSKQGRQGGEEAGRKMERDRERETHSHPTQTHTPVPHSLPGPHGGPTCVSRRASRALAVKNGGSVLAVLVSTDPEVRERAQAAQNAPAQPRPQRPLRPRRPLDTGLERLQ